MLSVTPNHYELQVHVNTWRMCRPETPCIGSTVDVSIERNYLRSRVKAAVALHKCSVRTAVSRLQLEHYPQLTFENHLKRFINAPILDEQRFVGTDVYRMATELREFSSQGVTKVSYSGKDGEVISIELKQMLCVYRLCPLCNYMWIDTCMCYPRHRTLPIR